VRKHIKLVWKYIAKYIAKIQFSKEEGEKIVAHHGWAMKKIL